VRHFLRTALLAIDALLIVLFVAGYLAYYVRPTVIWWFELIAVFLPYLALLILATSVLLLAAGRWRHAALHGVLILLMLVRMNPFDRLEGDRIAATDTLSVLSFNVPRWWGYEMPAKTVEMSRFVQRTDPDVIGLQEADVVYHTEVPYVRAAPYVAILYDSLGYYTIGQESTGATWTPQPVLSKHRVVRQQEFKLSPSPRDTSYTYVTRTQIRWNGRPFALYNVHLRTFGEKKPWRDERMPYFALGNLLPYLRQYRDAYRVRAWEVEEIVKMVEQEELPVVLCGDLNSTPNNWVHGRLTDVLRDAFGEEGTGWGMTYHSRLPVVRIDYVFVSKEWDVLSARVLDAQLSDHLPLLVELRLKPDEE
jgi:endonuclease/exonuclease/phosphatase family metal-dependent hydrolase